METAHGIIASIHEGHTEGTAGAELCVNMLVVAEVFGELLYIDGLLVRVEVSLALKSSVVDQEVSVSDDTRD